MNFPPEMFAMPRMAGGNVRLPAAKSSQPQGDGRWAMAPDAERARVCCALFCGIPGSGKSTLARRLEAHLQGLPAVTPARVCFDEDYQPEGFGEPGSGEYDPAAWKEGRERALSRLDRELGSAPDGTGTRKLVIADDNIDDFFDSSQPWMTQVIRQGTRERVRSPSTMLQRRWKS